MKIVKIVFLALTPLLFVACSNMTIGLEEDSRFYDGPMYDNRKNAVDENTSPANEKSVKKEAVAEKRVETKASKELSEVKSPKKIVEKPSEDETTFSYERDDE